jgi:hypothetical protein
MLLPLRTSEHALAREVVGSLRPGLWRVRKDIVLPLIEQLPDGWVTISARLAQRGMTPHNARPTRTAPAMWSTTKPATRRPGRDDGRQISTRRARGRSGGRHAKRRHLPHAGRVPSFIRMGLSATPGRSVRVDRVGIPSGHTVGQDLLMISDVHRL